MSNYLVDGSFPFNISEHVYKWETPLSYGEAYQLSCDRKIEYFNIKLMNASPKNCVKIRKKLTKIKRAKAAIRKKYPGDFI